MSVVSGVSLLSASGDGSVTVAAGATRYINLPNSGQIHVIPIQYKVTNTGTNPDIQFKFQGRATDADDWVDLKQNDGSTNAAVDTAGAVVSAIMYVRAMPQMRVNITEVTATGAGFVANIKAVADVKFAA